MIPFKAFGGSIGQAEFENVFLVYDVLLSESRFRGAKDGMNFIMEILRNTSLMSEEKYNLLK